MRVIILERMVELFGGGVWDWVASKKYDGSLSDDANAWQFCN